MAEGRGWIRPARAACLTWLPSRLLMHATGHALLPACWVSTSGAPLPPIRRWHLFDAAIVISSFALELSLRGVAQEVASLLIFFRCTPFSQLGLHACKLCE